MQNFSELPCPCARRFLRVKIVAMMIPSPRHSARGNVFVMIFMAIVLLGLLTAAIRGFSGGRDTITQEQLKINAAQVLRDAAELALGVDQVIRNGASETALRFAHPDAAADYGSIATTPAYQVFSESGGQARYHTAPADIIASGSGAWEFYGTTAIPQIGSDAPELIAVLPYVTASFCTAVNKQLGLTGQPDDSVTGTTPDCVEGGASKRFGPGAGFNATPNVLDSSSFSKLPMMHACVTCGTDYHFYSVLLTR